MLIYQNPDFKCPPNYNTLSFELFSLFYVHVCVHDCICICVTCMEVPEEGRGGCQSSWSWSYKWLLAAWCGCRWSSAWVARAPNQ